MNTFKIKIFDYGFTETLVYEAEYFCKRYKRDESGYQGLDKAWEFEKLPKALIEALESRDMLLIMESLQPEE